MDELRNNQSRLFALGLVIVVSIFATVAGWYVHNHPADRPEITENEAEAIAIEVARKHGYPVLPGVQADAKVLDGEWNVIVHRPTDMSGETYVILDLHGRLLNVFD